MEIPPSLHYAKDAEVDTFVVADGTTDYDVRANESNFTRIPHSFFVEISDTTATISVKPVYINRADGSENTADAHVITPEDVPYAFPVGPKVNILISVSGGEASTIKVVNY